VNTVSIDEWVGGAENITRSRRALLFVGGLLIAVATACASTLVATEGEPLVVAPLVGAVVGLAVFARPVLGVYLLFAAAILLEEFAIPGLEPLTAQTNFFQNISSFTEVPVRLSAADLLASLTLTSWALRRAVGANAPVRIGPFGWGVAVYLLAFILGAIIGFSRGGKWDGIAMLAEARGPLYLGLLYFLSANLVRERGQVLVLLWEFVLLVGVKGLQGVGNYVEMLNRGYQLQAVTAHEDVIFFDVAIALALVMVVLHVRGKLFWVLLAVQPMIIAAELMTQRRVAFAALAATVAVVAAMAAVQRPRATLLVVVAGLLAFGGYVAMFWDQGGPLAEPVHVIREVVDPYSISERDRQSNVWRDIENRNIAFTLRQLPLTGVGLGQEYLFQRQPPQLSDSMTYWRLITHNAVLWMWLKAGPFGAFAFWFLVTQVVLFGLQLYRRLDDPLLRVAAAFPVLLMTAQVVFSSVDLGLTGSRTMIILGVALGLAAPLTAWSASRRGLDRPNALAVGQKPPASDRTTRGTSAGVGHRTPNLGW
jgi:hypothetical protein